MGEQHVTFNVCWDAAGRITKSSAEQNFYQTPLGKAWAWEYTALPAYSSSPRGGLVTSWTLPFVAQGCIGTKYSPVCTVNEKYRTTVTWWGPAFIGPHQGTDQDGYWEAECTVTACEGYSISFTDD